MSSDGQGVTTGGAARHALAPREAAAGPPATAVSTKFRLLQLRAMPSQKLQRGRTAARRE